MIEEAEQQLKDKKPEAKKSTQALQEWKTKQKAFEEWVRSPLTQKMTEAIGYLKQSEIWERVEQIAEEQRMFQTVRNLVEQAGQREGKMRRIRGQIYFMETDGQSVFIMRDDKPIFHASDNRKQGGNVQTHWMEMTEGDRQTIQRLFERVQEHLSQQQRRSQSRGMSL